MKGFFKMQQIAYTLPLLLLLLPGCALFDWFSKKTSETKSVNDMITAVQDVETIEPTKMTGDPLVWIDGKVIVTSDSLQDERKKLFEAQPQLQQIVALIGEQELNKNLAEGLANQAVVDKYIQEKNIDQRTDYLAEVAQGYQAVIRMVNMKFFQDDHMKQATVSDSKAREYYEAQKDILPGVVTQQGGVQAMGIMFSRKEDADVFKAELQAMGDKSEKMLRTNIAALADSKGIAVDLKDFGTVNILSSAVDSAVKDQILGVEKTPSAMVVTSSNGTYWVIAALDKNPTEYRAFEEIKEDVKQLLMQEEQGKQFEKNMNSLRDKYKITFDDKYFASQGGAGMMPPMDMDFEQ
jgi:hypothetical protein